MAREHLLKIGVSGIRGVVGEFLTPALACAFARGVRHLCGRGPRGGGPRHPIERPDAGARRDLRPAGGRLRGGGRWASCPRPPFRCTWRPPRASGGIALTASHNPPEYNALKLFN